MSEQRMAEQVTMNKDSTEILKSDLRALLFWASIGIRSARGGQYQDDIEHILESYAAAIGFKFPDGVKPAWAADRGGK